MYATHFDLDGRLFPPGIAQDDARFADEREEDPALRAAVALSASDSVLVLLGAPGIGKTTFAANAFRAATGGMRSAIAWLGTSPASAHELLELLLAEFGFEPYRQSRAERLQTWRQYLTELGATDTRVFVALERAHEFEASVLSALDALTTADANGCPGASLVLMGTDLFASRLAEPPLEPLRQRVRLVRRLRPLDADGVERYLRHAAVRAGGNFERLFTADAIAALARHSRGIPRVLNHLADAALGLAAMRGASLVDAAFVSNVAADVSGFASLVTASEPVSTSAGASTASPDDDIPVLTESVEGEPEAALAPGGEEALDILDMAATMTLLGDDLDGLSAEIAAGALAGNTVAADRMRARTKVGVPGTDAADSAAAAEGDNTGAADEAVEAARLRRKTRRRAAG